MKFNWMGSFLLGLLAASQPAIGGPIRSVGGSGPPNLLSPRQGGSWDLSFEQPPNLTGRIGTSEIVGELDFESELANDFVLEEGAELQFIEWWGGYFNYTPGDPHVTGFNIVLYDDDAGKPGAIIAEFVVDGNETFLGQQGIYPLYSYTAEIEQALPGGLTYWCTIQAVDHPFPPQWGRLAAGSIVGNQSQFRSEYFGFPDWTPTGTVFGQPIDASASFYASTAVSGRLICSDGTSLANCGVTASFYDRNGFVGSTNTTTDALGFWSTNLNCARPWYFGAYWEITGDCCEQPFHIPAKGPLTFGVCSGNLGTQTCYTCGHDPGGPCPCLDLVFVVDCTGSMSGAITNLKAGLTNVLATAQSLCGHTKAAVISFNDQVTVHQDLTSNLSAVQATIQNLTTCAGGNFPEASNEALREAVDLANSRCLVSGNFDPLKYRPGCCKIVVLVTDDQPGGCNDRFDVGPNGDAADANAVAGIAASLGVKICAINVSGTAPVGIMQNYASVTGGFYATTPSTGTGVAAIVEQSILDLCALGGDAELCCLPDDRCTWVPGGDCSRLGGRIVPNCTECGEPQGQIAGFKFLDEDCDGEQDFGEVGLPGWKINLTGQKTDTRTTDAGGFGDFGLVPLGSYQLFETMSPGWVPSTPPGGVCDIEVTATDGYGCTFGNCACLDDSCQSLPACLTAYYPFDECSGGIARDLAAGNHGTRGSAGTWVPGYSGLALNCAIDFSVAQSSWVEAPDATENRFGTGSFSILAWVKPRVIDANIHMIVAKAFEAPPILGYQLYLQNGILNLDYGDGTTGGANHFVMSSGPPMSAGQWYLVGATVSRPPDPECPPRLFVLGDWVDTFTANPTGSIDVSIPLNIGATHQFASGLRHYQFDGVIDEVQLYDCCLDNSQLFPLASPAAPYCKQWVHVPSVTVSNSCGGGASVPIDFTIFNANAGPSTVRWSVAPIGPGSDCTVAPRYILPFASTGSVTVPGWTGSPGALTQNFTVHLPPGMFVGDTACYEITVRDEDGHCFYGTGKVRMTCGPIENPSWGGMAYVAPNDPTPVRYVLGNIQGADPMVIDYRVQGRSADGEEANQIVSLNGLPPGTPFEGQVVVPLQGEVFIDFDAALTGFQPFTAHEVILSLDLGGGNGFEETAGTPLLSVTEAAAAGLPEIDATSPPTGPNGTGVHLIATPNPFRTQTTISFDLAAGQTVRNASVYDVSGRFVKDLYTGSLGSGHQLITWDGKDRDGRLVPTGIYFARVQGLGLESRTVLIRME